MGARVLFQACRMGHAWWIKGQGFLQVLWFPLSAYFTRLECIYCLKQLSGGDIYIYYIKKLHVSALDNSHLQVAYENT